MINRIVALIFIILIVVLSAWFNFWPEIMGFSCVAVLLTSELIAFYQFKQNTKVTNLVKLKSNKWIEDWVIAALMIYWLSGNQMNTWSIMGIIGVVAYGILGSIRNYDKTYSLSAEGIRNLSTNNLISSSAIKEIDFGDDQISIHTSKARNELVFQASKVKSPDWDYLKVLISRFSTSDWEVINS